MSDVKFTRLREYVSKIGSGKTPRGGASSYQATGIPLIRSQNVLSGALNLNDVAFISNDIHAQMSGSAVKGKDVLLNITGASIGRSCVAPDSLTEANVNQHVCIIRTKDTLEPHFLSAFLNSYEGQKQIWSFQGGGSREGLNFEQIGRFIVPVFSLPEQRKIAEILRAWDEAIEKLEVLRAAKERCRNWLCSHLISLGAQDAPRVTFGEFLTESREQGANGVTARKISVKLYGKGAVEKPGSRTGSKNTRYYRRSAGQLVYSKLDFLNGAFAIVDQALDGFESTLDLPAFDVSPEVNAKWLIEYLTRPAFYSQQVHLARGQRKARRIAPDDFLASMLRLPNQTEQDRIVEILAQADHELSMEVQTLKLIRDQKRGLMQKLLTGEWRVPVEGRHD